VDVESAIYQWQQGERRLAAERPERAVRLQRVIEAIVAELRSRLGGRFTSRGMVELHRAGTFWCLLEAMRVAAEDPGAWEAAIVVDAAFARYLREATDYAGGRTGAAA